ncbi:hypothetical protein F4703DRAFT_1922438 [Phycomyces blakesleeanus]|uniref:Uncharacterized protein n=1 Tax=Phycomyces blakesleeanus (strain ATCC 8743b / DSM 1359 / FGSC 10004 / NBRC 33097 / NRRL 1555) TaxID=763407 RepID=A0A167QKC6_PHYB8|nr:hypothetical protein PHYBLDRAFT_139848 [Phycomyces blakesleeanus NRRL 1555(-)]OAD79834.1 hypothetical protein PHYBLDRAFT_139848 [Phycomyces blakesleeanus NRRL 1555(-)]|eukprot:XP_018297874.1 hypothetical protein PHYBLDRAFT_139848 [Phycomyces blakesleeanus NRRL 1555(-)]
MSLSDLLNLAYGWLKPASNRSRLTGVVQLASYITACVLAVLSTVSLFCAFIALSMCDDLGRISAATRNRLWVTFKERMQQVDWTAVMTLITTHLSKITSEKNPWSALYALYPVFGSINIHTVQGFVLRIPSYFSHYFNISPGTKPSYA